MTTFQISPTTSFEQRLEQRDRLLAGLAQATQSLLAIENLEDAIQTALRQIGEAVAVDRVYVFQNHPHSVTGQPAASQRWEWVRISELAEIENAELQDLLYEVICPPGWEEELAAGYTFAERVQDLPEPFATHLAKQQIRSILVTPIRFQGTFWGFVGFDDCQTDRQWETVEINSLQTLANSIGGAIIHQQTQQHLKQLNQDLEATVVDRTRALNESQARLRKLTENVPGMIYQFRLEPDGTMSFPYISSGVVELYGLSPADVQQDVNTILQCTHPDEMAVFQQSIARSAQTLTPWSWVGRIQTRSGQMKWIQGASQPERMADGAIVWDGLLMDVTERKTAELVLQGAMQQAEYQANLLRTVVDALPMGIFWKDQSSTYLGCNHFLSTVAGLQSPDEIVGKSDYDLPWTEEEAAFYRDCDRRVMSSKTPELGIIETQLQADGQQKWRETNKLPLFNVTGEVIGIVGTFQDITTRRAAELKLQQQEEFLRSIYDGAEMAIFVLDVSPEGELRYVSANAFASRLHRFSGNEFVGKTLEEVHGPEVSRYLRSNHDQCIATGTPVTFEEQWTVQGTPTWWLTTINPLTDDMGRVFRIVGSAIEVTDRKQAEAAAEERTRLMAFRSEVDSSITRAETLHDTLKVCTDAMVEQLEAAFARIWTIGDDPQMLELQVSSGLYTHLNGAHGRVPVGQFKIGQIAATRQPHLTNSVQTDPRVGDKEWAKREGMVSFAGYPLVVEDQLIGVIAMFARHPLSDTILNALAQATHAIALGIQRRNAEVALRQSEAKLRAQTQNLQQTLTELQRTQTQLIQSEKMSSLGQLVAGVAHEINNPVNFIHGNVNHIDQYVKDLLRAIKLYQHHYPQPDPAIAEYLEEIDLAFMTADLPKVLDSMKLGTQRIREIVLTLRNFSRLDEAEMKPVNIHDGINSTLVILQNRLKAKPNHSEIQVIKTYGALPPIECYAGQLNQVFMNLIVNAIDALDEHMQTAALKGIEIPAPCIQIRTELTSAQTVQIRICDNGKGIPDPVRSRLFDPFFTTKAVGKGTGLGLSISYQIVVDKHHGRLWCESEPGRTEFVIEIPIGPAVS